MASIELKQISKAFGDTTVLKTLDLAIHAGEFLTLVGPSGCGKSTLLRILAGLEAPDTGTIDIAGTTVNSVRASQRNLAMVFQSYALYPHLNVAENMMTPLKLRDLSFAQRLPVVGPLLARQKYRELLGQVEDTAKILKIEELLHRKPSQLSGGQRQRAALGRAMVRKPVAFLMDEPLSNLDAELRIHMRAELVQLHKSLGTTFIYVTHDQAEALTMSDRMAVMRNGRILQLDSPAAIYNQPDTLEVAKFIGSPKINILDAHVERGRVHLDGASIGLSLDPAFNSRISIGIRSEHLSVEPLVARGALKGVITYQENLGSDIYCHVDLVGREETVIARLHPDRHSGLTTGAQVGLHFDLRHLLLFGQDGGRVSLRTEAGAPHMKKKVA